jgi:positive regulator of sigma E activity
MVECGIVGKVEKNMAWVTVAKGEHCQGCTACSGFGQGSAQLIAKNELAAQPGETVEIEIDPKQVVKHSAIVFLLPVAGLIFGYFLGAQYLIKLGLATEGAGIVGSFGLLILTIIGIHFYDRTIGKSSVTNARIIRRV